MALWWIPRGHVPSVSEAEKRLEHLSMHGPTLQAFTFRQPFSPPGTMDPVERRDQDFCPSP